MNMAMCVSKQLLLLRGSALFRRNHTRSSIHLSYLQYETGLAVELLTNLSTPNSLSSLQILFESFAIVNQAADLTELGEIHAGVHQRNRSIV